MTRTIKDIDAAIVDRVSLLDFDFVLGAVQECDGGYSGGCGSGPGLESRSGLTSLQELVEERWALVEQATLLRDLASLDWMEADEAIIKATRRLAKSVRKANQRQADEDRE